MLGWVEAALRGRVERAIVSFLVTRPVGPLTVEERCHVRYLLQGLRWRGPGPRPPIQHHDDCAAEHRAFWDAHEARRRA